LTLFGVGILVAVGLCTRDKEKQLGGRPGLNGKESEA